LELKELYGESYYHDKSGMLLQGNCLDWMKKIPDNSVDLICTDPPYRVISGGRDNSELSKRHKGSIVTGKNDGKIFEENDMDCKDWMPEVFRVLKSNSHCYIMSNLINLENFLQVSQSTGFKLHNLLIWEKQNSTPNRWYMKNCEYILFLRKGSAFAINNMGSKTVHSFDNIIGNKTHPTEKPVSLMEFYITNSSKMGEIVLDPFVGSGSVAIACKNLNRRWICIEKDKKYCEISKKRIESWVKTQ
jgi:site-specific DNA-methyltransferase (adenine-specific)